MDVDDDGYGSADGNNGKEEEEVPVRRTLYGLGDNHDGSAGRVLWRDAKSLIYGVHHWLLDELEHGTDEEQDDAIYAYAAVLAWWDAARKPPKIVRAARLVHPRQLPSGDLHANCRFRCHADLYRVAAALRLPKKIKTIDTGSNVTRDMALLVLCSRLAHTGSWRQWEKEYGWSRAWLRDVLKTTVKMILANKGYRLEMDVEDMLRDRDRYCSAIAAKGAPFRTCVGFIDGTIRKTARPTRGQRAWYSGHKAIHGMKFQSVVTPDGLIIDAWGPYAGSFADGKLLRDSRLLERWRPALRTDDVEQLNYCLYGDPAYPRCDILMANVKDPYATPAQRRVNKAMKPLRETVEWGFQKISVNYFRYFQEPVHLQALKAEVGSMYRAAILLTNCFTCLYGVQTSDYFDLAPPTLETYLHEPELEEADGDLADAEDEVEDDL